MFVLAVLAIAPCAIAQDVECPAPLTTMPGSHWRYNSDVSVYISPAFTGGLRQAVADSVVAWETHGYNDSKVRFHVLPEGAADPGSDAANTLRVLRESGVYDVASMAYRPMPNSGDLRLLPGITDPGALLRTATHELGHSFGLDDCDSCLPDMTVMARRPNGNLNDLGGLTMPTVCDMQKAMGTMAAMRNSYEQKRGAGGGPNHDGDNTPTGEDVNCYEVWLETWEWRLGIGWVKVDEVLLRTVCG